MSQVAQVPCVDASATCPALFPPGRTLDWQDPKEVAEAFEDAPQSALRGYRGGSLVRKARKGRRVCHKGLPA